MAYEIPSFTVGTLPANIDMNTDAFQYTGVDLVAAAADVVQPDGCALTPASAGSPVFGILQNKPKKNQEATVMTDGVTMALAGGTIAVAAYVKIGADGKFVTSAAADAIGRALSAAVAGDIFTVALRALK